MNKAMPVKPTEQVLGERRCVNAANLRSVRWAKSSQGIRRGTCGWITSYFFLFLTEKKTTTEMFIPTFLFLFSNGLVAQSGRAPALHRMSFFGSSKQRGAPSSNLGESIHGKTLRTKRATRRPRFENPENLRFSVP